MLKEELRGPVPAAAAARVLHHPSARPAGHQSRCLLGPAGKERGGRKVCRGLHVWLGTSRSSPPEQQVAARAGAPVPAGAVGTRANGRRRGAGLPHTELGSLFTCAVSERGRSRAARAGQPLRARRRLAPHDTCARDQEERRWLGEEGPSETDRPKGAGREGEEYAGALHSSQSVRGHAHTDLDRGYTRWGVTCSASCAERCPSPTNPNPLRRLQRVGVPRRLPQRRAAGAAPASILCDR